MEKTRENRITGRVKAAVLVLLAVCIMAAFQMTVFAGAYQVPYGTFRNGPDKEAIYRMMTADYPYPNDQYQIYVYKWNIRAASKFLCNFEDRYMPYYGITSSAGVVDKGTYILIAFYPNKIKEEIQKSKKNAASMKKTAKSIIKGKTTAKQKAVAIQQYVSKTLKYRSNLYDLNKAVKKKKGCCYAYASYYNALCTAAGLESRRCNGYAYGDGTWSGHAWNKVKIGGTWYYVDCCWAKNYPEYAMSKKLWNDHELD